MKKQTRRSFFKISALTIASIPFVSKFSFAEEAKECGAAPEGLKKVAKEGEKSEKRLSYVQDATTSTHKKYKAGDNCGNCKFYKTKKEEGGWAPCNMLANRYVSSCGWCKSYKRDKKKS